MTNFNAEYVMAIDQGTTSSRAIIFDKAGNIVSVGQFEHEQIFPQPGWVEHNPLEIWENVNKSIGTALAELGINRHSLAGVGITNQRETVVVWDKNTGEPVYNAIVWQDTRTQPICDALAQAKDADGKEYGPDRFKTKVGLPLAPYFSASKVQWILDNVPGVRERAEKGDLLLGTMDTWVLWNLTGGVEGGVHVTDVTNASRTLLMDITTLEWDKEMCDAFTIPMSMLPEIKSSSEVYGYGSKNSLLIDTPIAGILGDQQAATFGQTCFSVGQVKNTYGTGCFMLMNTGEEIVHSKNGLLTTVLYKLGDEKPVYALEGSIAVTGSLIQWLRDNLGFFENAKEVEAIAAQAQDNGGVYFVPAFSGLFAPYWRPDARGVLVGMTRFVNKSHICRAALEATAFQTYEVVQAMQADSDAKLPVLKVDGGMTANNLLMQFQSDILGTEVVCSKIKETTALGAAYVAGLAVGLWKNLDELKENWQAAESWEPTISEEERAEKLHWWQKAVTKSFDWVE